MNNINNLISGTPDNNLLSRCENFNMSPQCSGANNYLIKVQYIPLISPVWGPYGKLWTEFFPSFYGPSAKRVGHENKEGKNEDP